jgi:hypothetical protein
MIQVTILYIYLRYVLSAISMGNLSLDRGRSHDQNLRHYGYCGSL